MNTQLNAVSETSLESRAAAPAAMTATRPMFWSVQRELWENRSLYFAPVAVACVILFGLLISGIRMLPKMRDALSDPANLRVAVQVPYDATAAILIVTALIIGMFYCLDALYGERRDRSILFWKSLPISDLTTVLAKASVPLVVLPLVTFAVIATTHVIILLTSVVFLPGNGVSAGTLWAELPLFKMWLALFYSLIAIALWHAPIYGWLLLVSGYARRATFLWAVLPLFAIGVLEKIAFDSHHFAVFLRDRLLGWFQLAYLPQHDGNMPLDPLRGLTPARFFSSPGLWGGLIVAAIFLFVAVRQRRYQGPI